MHVDGPPEVWPGYAPVWGLCADLLEKSHFFVKIRFFVNFSFRALKLLANREEQLLTFFGFLPPYFDVSRSLAYFIAKNFSRSSIHIKNSSLHAVWLGIRKFDRFSIDVRYKQFKIFGAFSKFGRRWEDDSKRIG